MSPPTTDVRAIAAAALDLSSLTSQGGHVTAISAPALVLPPLESRSYPAPSNRLPRLPPLNSVFFPWAPIQFQQHHPYLQQPAIATGACVSPPRYPEAALHPHLLLHPPVSTPAPLPRPRDWPSEPGRPSQNALNINKQHAETHSGSGRPGQHRLAGPEAGEGQNEEGRAQPVLPPRKLVERFRASLEEQLELDYRCLDQRARQLKQAELAELDREKKTYKLQAKEAEAIADEKQRAYQLDRVKRNHVKRVVSIRKRHRRYPRAQEVWQISKR
ncbi:uncharacterized protein B0H64DRAFT_385375 [Chaetomium fimeti]|uniref:Uncharacterized protein n=1 Tax=Chaetomium fimeti TaxID=1854472 RepID=A0AAE0HL47_9PEZI|nr:hypothetical protein B0H64DRAFT_385375 [Chaetomium fimeti]